jgi:hypothetical protein
MLPKESPAIEALIEVVSLAQCRIDAIFAILEKREIIISQEILENESLKIFQRDKEIRRNNIISLMNLHRMS